MRRSLYRNWSTDKIQFAASLGLAKVMYAEYDGPPLPPLNGLFVLITILSILPYWPKWSRLRNLDSEAMSGAKPITYTSVFWMTLKFANFLTLSFDNVLIGILFCPFLGKKPNDFIDLTQISVNVFLLQQYTQSISKSFDLFLSVFGSFFDSSELLLLSFCWPSSTSYTSMSLALLLESPLSLKLLY